MNIKLVLRLLLSIGIIITIVVCYSLSITISLYSYNLGIYFVTITGYIICQIVFSLLNRYNKTYLSVNSGEYDTEHSSKLINVTISGYRKDPIFFKDCLQSVLLLDMQNINKIFIVIDGQSDDDKYMVDIFNEVFDHKIYYNLNLEKLLHNLTPDEQLDIYNKIAEYKYICITQPHDGKRNVMYTAFKLSLIESKINPLLNAMFSSDSDTVLVRNTIAELYKCLKYDKVGAVSGELTIFNKNNSLVAFLQHLRYWFAFNLERGYQSYNKCVLYVSGPIGLYSLLAIEPILDEWKNQTFLNQECTYGDDRHLTNKILEKGYQVVCNPYSTASTESPEAIYRFYKQQTRWAKSSNREVCWSIFYIHLHSIFMTFDIIYCFVYPLICLSIILSTLIKCEVESVTIYIVIILSIGLIKGIIATLITKNCEYLVYTLYSIVYLLLLIPAKLYALLTVTYITWGTSSRKKISFKLEFDFLFLLLWNILIAGLFIRVLVIHLVMAQTYNMYNYILLVCIIIIIMMFIFMFIYIHYYTSKKVSVISSIETIAYII